MRLVIAHLDGLVPPEHGGARVARTIAEALAARGHGCHVIVPFAREWREPGGPIRPQRLGALQACGIPVRLSRAGTVSFSHRRVHYTGTLLSTGRFYRHLWVRIREIEPDAVLVTDVAGRHGRHLLATVLDAAPRRVAFRIQTVNRLPFGPAAVLPDAEATELLRDIARILVPSDFVRGYVQRWSTLEPVTSKLPLYGDGPFPDLGNPSEGLVMLINPCRWKGVAIFVGLAREMPDVAFGAVPSWGTTRSDLALLASLDNVQILPSSEDIDDVLRATRVLLVPSLWDEAFGLVVVEAMLRGIPVLASDVGGLPEAKLGVDHVLPVRPLELVEEADPTGSPHRSIREPEQDLEPWLAALRELLSNREAYVALSRESRRAATSFVSGLGWDAFERLLPGHDARPGAEGVTQGRRRMGASLP